MSEKFTQQPSEGQGNKLRALRSKSTRSNKHSTGIYSKRDNNAHILTYAVPVLAETLHAKNATYRSLVGKVGSLTRTASVYENDADRVTYDVFIERSLDTIEKTNRTIGRVTLQIVISYTHLLDEHEVITEWPLIEEVGAGDSLLVDASMLHIESVGIDEDIDLEQPEVVREIMQNQSESLSTLEEEDEETMIQVAFGGDIERYYEKKLRLTTGMQPSLSIGAGYQTDDASYELKLSDGFSRTLLGDTLAELDVMSRLSKETFTTIDAETMQEFLVALEVVGILKRHVKH